ncbi:MAG: EF-hand domain-containing protein [Thermoguttaceae bacterium]
MSRNILGWTAMILISLPCAAMADVYPSIPVPGAPGLTPQRLSPRQVFRWLDTNHDGFLTLNEFLAAPWVQNRPQATRFFRWMDTNNDGLVSLPEFVAAYTRFSGSSGYYVQLAYPWAWIYWRPWQYGWYWHSGWHHRPGVWQGYAGHAHLYTAGPHHVVKQVGPVTHAHPVHHIKAVTHAHAARHVKAVTHKSHGSHAGHAHAGHAHQGHHR